MKTISSITGAIAIQSMNLTAIPSSKNGYIGLDSADNKLKFYNQTLAVWENYNDVVTSAITVLKGGVPTDGDTLNKLNNKIIANTSSISTLSTTKINFTDIVDNLTSTDGTTKVLSANQGRVLKNYVDTNFYFKTDFVNSYVAVTTNDKPVKTSATTGKIDYSLIPILHSYSENNAAQTIIQNVRVYHGKLASSTSTAVFNITAQGTSGGTALFTNLENCNIQATTRSANVSNVQSPWCHIQSISGNVVTVRIKRSNGGSILIGGNYTGNVDNDLAVTVYLQITGQSA